MKLLLAAALFCAAAKPFPEPPRDYVHNEGVLAAANESILSARLEQIERASGMQFVVAIFQTLDGENLEEYTNKLFRRWKIGDARRNDGVLFAIFVNERKWRVEVGYGLEGRLTDAAAGHIARSEGVPFFQRYDFYGGCRAVIDALYARATGLTKPGPRRAQTVYPPPQFYVDTKIVVPLWFAAYALMHIVPICLCVWLSNRYPKRGIGRRRGGRYEAWISSGGGSSSSSSSSGGGGGGFSGGGGSSGGGGASGGW